MFRKKYQGRRHTNIVFVIFRLSLSLVMFVVLLAGIYSAYKHFSGLDPLKLDPQAIFREVVRAKTTDQFLSALTAVKFSQNLLPKIQNQKILGQSVDTGPNTAAKSASFKFLLFADSHNDNDNLQKVLTQAKQTYPDLSFIIGLGDYTDVGTLDELKSAKSVLDRAGLRYFLVAGDHDLWDARDKGKEPAANFQQIFGPLFQSFIFNNFKFLLLDNSDNYIGIPREQKDWIAAELEKAKVEKGIFVFISEPLFHPSSDHYMGKVDKDLRMQAQSLIYQLKGAGVKKVFAGDIHYFSEYEEPQTKLPMVTVGATVTERNPQTPRYSVVTVYEDGSTKVDDVGIK